MPYVSLIPERRYTVYLKGRKVRSFTRPVSWPFSWNIGTLLKVRGGFVRVVSIHERSGSWYAADGAPGLTRVFVRREPTKKSPI